MNSYSSSCSSSNLNNNKKTTTTNSLANIDDPDVDNQNSGLILPPGNLINASEASHALRVFDKLPQELQQLVADEWHGRLRMAKAGQCKPIPSKIGYLNSLVNLALQDKLIPSAAISVIEARQQSNEQRRVEQHESDEAIQNTLQDFELSDAELERKYSHLPDRIRQRMIKAAREYRTRGEGVNA